MKKLDFKDLTNISSPGNENSRGETENTRAFLLTANTESLAEFCGPCAVIDLSDADFTVSSESIIETAMKTCAQEIINRHFASSGLPEIKRWLFKTKNASANSKLQFSDKCVAVFKASGTVLVGFDFEPDQDFLQKLAATGIVSLTNLNLDEVEVYSSGMLICGPLKIKGQNTVPCRALMLV